jgi:hypothetical protein
MFIFNATIFYIQLLKLIVLNQKLKFLLILLSVLLLNQCKKDETNTVNILDNNFLNILIQKGIDSDGDGKISYSEASVVRSLDISGNNLSDITGIESFINLDTLYCFFNKLSSLDVSKCKNLIFLECRQNQLTSLDVSKNLALTTLRCGTNQFESLDVSNNILLEKLYCGEQPLNSLDISNHPALKELDC